MAYLGAAVIAPVTARRWKRTNGMTSLWLSVAGSIAGSAAFAGAALFRAAVQYLTGDTSTWVWLAGNAFGFAVFLAALAVLGPRSTGTA